MTEILLLFIPVFLYLFLRLWEELTKKETVK